MPMVCVLVIQGYLGSDKLNGLMDKFGSLSSNIDLDEILGHVSHLPEFIFNFTLTSNSLSLTFNPQHFRINELSAFDIEITFDSNSIKSVEVTNLKYNSYKIDLSISLGDYQKVQIVFQSKVFLL